MKQLLVSLAVCLFFSPVAAHAAEGRLYISPERGFYGVGDLFDVKVFADTDDEAIHAAEAEIIFDPNELYVEDVIVDNSILSLWPTPPEYSNETGTIRFSGWTIGRYAGEDGLLVTIIVRPLRVTLSSMRLESGALLAADDRSSNIITSMKSGVYTIGPRTELAEYGEEADLTELSVQLASAATTVVDPEPPEPPLLTEYPFGTVDVGERVVVKGTAPPNTKILLWTAKGDEPRQLTPLVSAADGSFTFVTDEGVEKGIYRVWAQSVDANGRQSEESKKIRFEAKPSGALAAVAATASVATALLPLLVLLLIAGLGIAYILHRQRMEQAARRR